MLYAKDESGERILPIPDTQAICPNCGGAVRAKCGEIKEWHWAHIDIQECDTWSEPESEWHRKWKESVPIYQREVTIEKNGQRHRADIEATDGTVIELQHSYISPEEIHEREAFYGNMLWIFDARDVWEAKRFELKDCGTYFKYRWKYSRKHIAYAEAPRYLHFGSYLLFELSEMYVKRSCYGRGRFVGVGKLVAQWQRMIGPERCIH